MTTNKFISLIIALGVLLWPAESVLAMEPPMLNLLVPENNEIWEVGSTHQITWFNSGLVYVDIAYTTTGSDNGPWITIAENIDATLANGYDWVIPNTPTSTALIRLIGGMRPDDDWVYSFGDGTFQIVTPVPTQMIKVVRPNGGEFWKMGSWQIIRWDSFGIDHQVPIRIEINRGNKWQTIGYAPNTGLLVWRVTGPKTNTALIRVSLKKDAKINDVSDNFFRISNK